MLKVFYVHMLNVHIVYVQQCFFTEDMKHRSTELESNLKLTQIAECIIREKKNLANVGKLYREEEKMIMIRNLG